MRTTWIVWVPAAVCMLLVGCGKSKAGHDAHAEKPAPSAEWKTVQMEDGSFTASFPGTPIIQFQQNNQGKQVLCGLDQPDGVTYSIIMNQVNQSDSKEDPRKRLKAVLAQAPISYGASAKIESTRQDLKVEGNPAAEYRLSFVNQGKPLKLSCRVFFAHDGHQLFQLIAAGPKGAPEAQKFFDQLKLGKYTPGKVVAAPSATPSPAAEQGHGS
ncbi:hypothetical protein IV102_32450 [bacterium]|nr:hypothetical protein [bacterium]